MGHGSYKKTEKIKKKRLLEKHTTQKKNSSSKEKTQKSKTNWSKELDQWGSNKYLSMRDDMAKVDPNLFVQNSLVLVCYDRLLFITEMFYRNR